MELKTVTFLGLVNRVKAFERLLEKHPEYLEKCIFLQVSLIN